MVYSEGKESYTLFPKGFKIPKMKKGQPVKIHAEVYEGKERTVISALKIEEVK